MSIKAKALLIDLEGVVYQDGHTIPGSISFIQYLDKINFPSDIRKLSENDLQNVSDEVRKEMISAVSETGGHLGAGLGVVELTVALHYVFDTPNDKLIWDVGHQSYPHKILTGRKNKIRTLRQGNGTDIPPK